MIKLNKREDKKFENGKLYYQSVSGWHIDDTKCTKVIGKYRVYAIHFNCALPYTKYLVANTKTGEVLVSEEHHWSVMKELVEQLRKEQQ